MHFIHNRTLIRRHQFLSITTASIVSYFYYHLFFRNIYTHALSPVKYAKLLSVFESGSKSNFQRSLTSASHYLYITKFHLSSNIEKCFITPPPTPTQSFDQGFRHSIANMDKNGKLEPSWVEESRQCEHESFDKLGSLYIPELGMLATNYRHKKSGLSVMSLKTHIDSGKEMSFCLAVPTPPLNSKGVPHVLEHSVLAGTPKYPSKDAFSILVQGGFTSFLNAVTYKDRTGYVFASTNEKSFYQTADMYMDSFFRPNVKHEKLIFDQECWHYKVKDATGEKSETDIELHGRHIGFSGIVYSEMKMRSSDSSTLFYYLTYENLFKNSYQFNSGGDPKDIVDLTHEELVKFYNMYYGPRTAVAYVYGPYDVKNRLDFLDKYLTTYNIGIDKDPKTGKLSHNANPAVADSNLPLEEYSPTPKYDSAKFSSGTPDEDEFMVSWLLDPVHNGSLDKFKLDFVDNVGFQVLQYVLMGTPESVLYKALIDSKFGKKVLAHGFSNEYKQAVFSVGLKGVDNKNHGSKQEMVKKFEEILFGALKRIKAEGFKRDAIDSGMNLVEFEMRELNTEFYPKGLALITTIQSQLQYGKDPFGLLRFDSLMAELRRRIFSDDPSKYFVNLLEKHLLNNTTRVTLHLEAVESSKFEKESNQKVVKQLESRLAHLSKEEVDKMEEYYKNFQEDRQKKDDPEVLEAFETLELADISREQETIPTVSYKLGSHSMSETDSYKAELNREPGEFVVHTHKLQSNGILYMNYALALDDFTVEELKYLGVFAAMLKEAGTDTLTPEEVSYKVDKNLGGLSFSSFFSTVSNNRTYDDPEKGVGFLVVRAKALQDKTVHMVDVVNDLLKNANFANAKKGLEFVKRSLSTYQSNIPSEGSEYAAMRMASRFSVPHYASEVVNGYSQMVFLRDVLVPLAEKDWNKVESVLNTMRNKLLKMRNLTVNLTGDSELVDSFVKDTSSWYNKMSSTFKADAPKVVENVWVKEVLDKKLMQSTDKNELLVVPSKVNFVGVGGKLFDKNDELQGSNSLVFHYLRRTMFFKLIRMALGAYGAQANLLSTGHVVFVSYADPNFEKTLKVYDQVPSNLFEAYETFSDKDLLRQKIGKMSQLDRPLHVENKSVLALKRLLINESNELRQAMREDILDATRECFKRLGERFQESNDWKWICSVVNNTTSNEASQDLKRLYMS